MNEEPLEEAERMFVKQEAKLAAEVEELQRLIGNMRDYRAKLDRVIAHEKHRARGESAKSKLSIRRLLSSKKLIPTWMKRWKAFPHRREKSQKLPGL